MRPVPCGTGAPARETMAAKTDRAKASSILSPITRVLTVLVAALREIFDESAYERFLARSEVTSSPAAYNDFLREGETARARRPRCC